MNTKLDNARIPLKGRSYNKKDAERLLSLLEKLNREVEDRGPRLPMGKDGELVIKLWKVQAESYHRLFLAILEGDHIGSVFDDRSTSDHGFASSPICTMPYVQPVKLPANTMKLPGPSKRGSKR